ncbi:GH1 family beta-glucosidase [soil metagenome]
MTAEYQFPDDFLWGAATSAYQIEGSPLADGAGASIWHRFVRTPGNVRLEDTGDVACDHYRRYASDVDLMAELGLRAYRFSISWSRVFPAGRGHLNQPGLDFYERLVDALLARDIRPVVTLFHWDLPAALDDMGGWLNRDIAGWFSDYASAVFRALEDRVEMWTTLNEPWVVVDGGYLHGALAPGHRSLFEAPIAAHNLLRAHAEAVRAYRAEGRGKIGLVVNLEPKHHASNRRRDREAAQRADAYMNRWYLDPVFLGEYPEALRAMFGEAWPEFSAADLEGIRATIDFLGVNYYSRSVVRDAPGLLPPGTARVWQRRATHTRTQWEVYPEGLVETLVGVRERYGDIPLYVTENGAAFYDPPVVGEEGVRDALRVIYLRDHLRAAHRAIDQGVDLRGYFVWSLFDNFEWALGYSKRFGIVHVDFETQARTLKESARFYADVIRTNGVSLS